MLFIEAILATSILSTVFRNTVAAFKSPRHEKAITPQPYYQIPEPDSPQSKQIIHQQAYQAVADDSNFSSRGTSRIQAYRESSFPSRGTSRIQAYQELSFPSGDTSHIQAYGRFSDPTSFQSQPQQQSSSQQPDLAFRDADRSEDDELARILYNAFQHIWNHNWFQTLAAPLPDIPRSPNHRLTPLQKRRFDFYRSWIRLNRAYQGKIIVAYTPHPIPDSEKMPRVPPGEIAAVALLLPPHARPSWGDLPTACRTGFLGGLVGLGAKGFCRAVFKFEGNVERMIARALHDLSSSIAQASNGAGKSGVGKQVNLIFVQACVRNPEWRAGRKPARRLLNWGIERWWQTDARIPVWLDTTTDEGERAYKEIGFQTVGACMVETGCDSEGIKLKKHSSFETKRDGRMVARQRVMIKMPPGLTT